MSIFSFLRPKHSKHMDTTVQWMSTVDDVYVHVDSDNVRANLCVISDHIVFFACRKVLG